MENTLSTSAKAAIGVAVAAFFVNITTFSSSTHNGVITNCSFMDYGALGLGLLAIILGIVAVADGRKREHGAQMAMGATAALLGVVHILRGIGMIGGPC